MSSLPQLHSFAQDANEDLDLTDRDSDLSNLSLEEELAAVNDDPLMNSTADHVDPNANQARAKDHYHTTAWPGPQRFAPMNAKHLEQWHSDLTLLTGQPCTETTHLALYKYASGLYNWITQAVIPHISALEHDAATNETYIQALQQDNKWLAAKVWFWRNEYGTLYEEYDREWARSRDKTRWFGEGMRRWEEGLLEIAMMFRGGDGWKKGAGKEGSMKRDGNDGGSGSEA